MKTTTHEHSYYDEDSGTSLTVHITVTHVPGIEVDKRVLDTAAEATVDCILDEGLNEVEREVTPYDLGLIGE